MDTESVKENVDPLLQWQSIDDQKNISADSLELNSPQVIDTNSETSASFLLERSIGPALIGTTSSLDSPAAPPSMRDDGDAKCPTTPTGAGDHHGLGNREAEEYADGLARELINVTHDMEEILSNQSAATTTVVETSGQEPPPRGEEEKFTPPEEKTAKIDEQVVNHEDNYNEELRKLVEVETLCGEPQLSAWQLKEKEQETDTTEQAHNKQVVEEPPSADQTQDQVQVPQEEERKLKELDHEGEIKVEESINEKLDEPIEENKASILEESLEHLEKVSHQEDEKNIEKEIEPICEEPADQVEDKKLEKKSSEIEIVEDTSREVLSEVIADQAIVQEPEDLVERDEESHEELPKQIEVIEEVNRGLEDLISKEDIQAISEVDSHKHLEPAEDKQTSDQVLEEIVDTRSIQPVDTDLLVQNQGATTNEMEFTKNYSDDLLMGQSDLGNQQGESMPSADLADFELPPYSGSSSGSEQAKQHSPVKRQPSSNSSSAAQPSSSHYNNAESSSPNLSAVKNLLLSSYSRVSHVLNWERPIETGIIFGIGLTLIITLSFFSIISVIAYSALGVILASAKIRVYKAITKALNRPSELPFDHIWNKIQGMNVSLSPEKTHELIDTSLSNLNASLLYLKQVLLFEDKVATVKFGLFLYMLTYIGAWFNGMTLITISYLALFSVPILYQKNKTKIDEYLNLVFGQLSSTISMITNKATSLTSGGGASASSSKKQN